ncbi:MAG: hypothetical protein GX364_08605 [Firmicutes bacterium]|mgnify:CR=1 FL=1|nr:hypothetical protein [Bacillota bacterium]
MEFETGKGETVHTVGRIVISDRVLNLFAAPFASRLEIIEKIVFSIEGGDLKVYARGKYRMFPFKALYTIRIDSLFFNAEKLELGFSFEEKVHSDSWALNLILKQISRRGSYLERFARKKDGISVIEDRVGVDLGSLLGISREGIVEKLGWDIFAMVSPGPISSTGEELLIDIGVTEDGLRKLVSESLEDMGDKE